MKNYFVKNLAVLVSIALWGVLQVSAAPINGDFEGGLVPPWNTTGNISLGNNEEFGNFVIFDGSGTTLTSTLSQTFTLDAGTQTLSFEMALFPPEAPPETDVFTASLSGPGITDPLFFSLDDELNQYAPTGTDVTPVIAAEKFTVTLDVSSLTAGGDIDVLLAFNLFSDNDGLITSVELYNVSTAGIPVVPAPAAIVLAFIGVGTVGLTRKLKIISGI